VADDAPTPDDAQRVARHLIGEDATPEEVQRWRRAIALHGAVIKTARDWRLWAAAMRRPWLLGFADAGLAWLDPYSPVRHRLALMLAILEASPHHHHRFLAAPWPRLRLFALAARGLAAALRVAAGILWVRSHGVLWR
jgi:hypothetical protein